MNDASTQFDEIHTPFNAAESTPLNDASRVSQITANVIEVRIG